MWDDDAPKPVGRPHLWIVFLVILVASASIFVWRPGVRVGESPSPATPANAAPATAPPLQPVVTLIDSTEKGTPLFAADAQIGMWAVHASGENALLVRFLSPLGDEQWSQTLPIGNALLASNGRHLAVGAAGATVFQVFHARRRHIAQIEAPGPLQALSVNGNGETLISFTVPQTTPAQLRTEVAHYSAQGHLMWRHSLADEQPVAVSQSMDGATTAFLSLDFTQGVSTRLTVWSRHGQQLFSERLDGRPGFLFVHPDGESVAISAGRTVHVFARSGATQFRHSAGGELTALRYFGDNLAFIIQSRAWLGLYEAHHVGLLDVRGRVVLTFRSRQPLIALSATAEGDELLAATANRLYVRGDNGQFAAELAHDWQENHILTTVDSTSHLVLTARGQVVQVRRE